MTEIERRVAQDLKEAMKARDAARTAALRMIRAALLEAAKSGRELTDAAAVDILRRLRKQRLDAAAQYRQGGREDLAAAEEAEVQVIDAYLPQLADEATTRQWVQEAIEATGATDPRMAGRVMGALMKAHRGEVDAALARRLVDELLGG